MKKLLPNRKKSKPQIVVTNLIDVILLLVFFFMITSSFANNIKKVPVNLPGASNSASVEGENLSVQITKDGKIHAQGKVLTVQKLEEVVKKYVSNAPSRPLLVEADKAASYGRIVQVLDTLRKAGGNNLGLSTTMEK